MSELLVDNIFGDRGCVIAEMRNGLLAFAAGARMLMYGEVIDLCAEPLWSENTACEERCTGIEYYHNPDANVQTIRMGRCVRFPNGLPM